MKYAIAMLFTLILSACGDSRLDATYSNNETGVAEQKASWTFKPDGTAQFSIGSTQVPAIMPYEIRGNKITIQGNEKGNIIFTVLDDGDLVVEGIRLKKENPSQRTPASIVAKAPEEKKPQEKDMTFCRELSAKARAATPGAFSGDPDFLPNVSLCYKLAKEAGEVLVWSSENPSSPKDLNLK